MDYTKREVRDQLRATRRSRSVAFDFAPLLTSQEFLDAKVVASYNSYGNEPDTTALNSAILDSGRVLLLPRRRRDGSLDFVSWDGNSALLQRVGKVLEPIGDPYLGPIDLIILPSLAADLSGNRLGQGGGSYDRTLPNYSSWRVTLLFDDELLDHIPHEAHDQKIHAVLLPERLVRL